MNLPTPFCFLQKIDNEAKDRHPALDGLRARAALCVLGSHTSALPLPFGTLGVLLFFNLSAFLLSLSFLLNDQLYSLRRNGWLLHPSNISDYADVDRICIYSRSTSSRW